MAKVESLKERLINIAVTVARIILGVTFIVSGFVKAVDPMGTVYKFQDYITATGLPQLIPVWLLTVVAVALSTLEMIMGICLLLAITRRVVSKLAAAFMVVMTCLTIWIYAANPVKDCGCFGDAIVLTNGQTLLKNIILLICAIIIVRWPLRMKRLMNRGNQMLVLQICGIAAIVLSAWCLYDLPVLDFRPYKVGTNIKEAMTIPEGAQQPEFETTFIMEKDGVQKEFSLDDYPDSTWTFVDSKTKTIREGYVPQIHDFSIMTADGDDITEDILSRKGFTLLLIAPFLDRADDSCFGDIDAIYEYAKEHEWPFYCLTSSTEKDISHWKDITGAEYPFCMTDGTTLKTIVRSNPGLLLLKNGTIMGKWSSNRLPNEETLNTFN